MDLRPGQLVVTPRASGSASVSVYTQKRDANGAPTTGEFVTERSTDNTGTVRFDLVSGAYVVKVRNQTLNNVVIQRGQVTQISP